MSVGEIEQKVADRFQELFHSSWARATDSLITMLISIWLYAAIWENKNFPSQTPRPLSWWRAQLAQAGIHYPRWLDIVTNWHAPHEGNVVLLALAVGAVSSAVGIRQSGAPGFTILALLALTLGTQWFGLGRMMTYYGALVILLVTAALFMAARSWSIDRHRIVVELSGTHFTMTTITYGLMSGPLGVILFPIIYPVILFSKAVRTLGYDHDQQRGPIAVDLLQRELRELEQSTTPVTDLSAAKATRLLTLVQVIAASPATSHKALDMLNSQLPSGAVQRSENQNPREIVRNTLSNRTC